MSKGSRIGRAPYLPVAPIPHVERMDIELQTFLFVFLPALFAEISDHLEEGFSHEQVKQIDRYFNQAITLAAIAHPHKQYLIFGRQIYRKIRGLHEYFQTWCSLCCESSNPSDAKKNTKKKMEDALAVLSHKYHIAANISLDDEQKNLVIAVSTSITDIIKGLPRVGLRYLDSFAESSVSMPGKVTKRAAARRRSPG